MLLTCMKSISRNESFVFARCNLQTKLQAYQMKKKTHISREHKEMLKPESSIICWFLSDNNESAANKQLYRSCQTDTHFFPRTTRDRITLVLQKQSKMRQNHKTTSIMNSESHIIFSQYPEKLENLHMHYTRYV